MNKETLREIRTLLAEARREAHDADALQDATAPIQPAVTRLACSVKYLSSACYLLLDRVVEMENRP